MSGEKWSRDEEMTLIELVSFHKCLYDASHEKYKDVISKNNTWKEIANNMEVKSDEDCKRRWRSIRDTYKKLKREGKFGTGSAAIGKTKWPLLNYLSFLENVSEERRTITNLFEDSQEIDNGRQDVNVESENIESVQLVDESVPSPASTASTPSISRGGTKRKITSTSEITTLLQENRKSRERLIESFLEKMSSEKDDDVDIFYKSIAMTVKRLPPHLISKAKLKHLQIVNDLEFEATQQKSMVVQNQQAVGCTSHSHEFQLTSCSSDSVMNFRTGEETDQNLYDL